MAVSTEFVPDQSKTEAVEAHVIWMTTGLSCDGEVGKLAQRLLIGRRIGAEALDHGLGRRLEGDQRLCGIEAAEAGVGLGIVLGFAGYELHDQVPGLVGAARVPGHAI